MTGRLPVLFVSHLFISVLKKVYERGAFFQ